MSFLCEVFAPDEVGATPVAPHAAISADERVLLTALRPDVPLAIWLRDVPKGWEAMLAPMLVRAPFTAIAEARPDLAVERLAEKLPLRVPVELLADIYRLGTLFAAMTGHDQVRLRLEAVTGDACRRFHVDAVGYRMLCTYAGAGTEWCMGDPELCQVSRAPLCGVAMFRGRKLAGAHCLHRSPPITRTQEGPRLLLCCDEPGVFHHDA